MFAAMKIYGEIGDNKGIADANRMIGLIYAKDGKYTEALQQYSASLKMLNELNLRGGIAFCYNSIGNIYELQGDSALAAGNENFFKNKYFEALQNHIKSLTIRKAMGNQTWIAASFNFIGRAQLKLKKYKEARVNLENALQVFKEKRVTGELSFLYETLSTLDSAQGNYKLQ
jgi:tetratricopeptide (TPR) repeat protein